MAPGLRSDTISFTKINKLYNFFFFSKIYILAFDYNNILILYS